jgi:transposase
MISIGIDWADDKHDICIRDLEDRRILAALTITHDAQGVAELEATVAALGSSPAESVVAIETPHGLLVGYLLQQGYAVYALPPRAVERYRDRQRLSGAKSDAVDAATLADILCIDRDYHHPIPADSPLALELRLVSRQRQKLVGEQTRLKNQLTACLKAYYPVAVTLFARLELAITRAFLQTYPNATVAQQASLAELTAFFRQQGYTCPRKIPAVYAQLQAPAIPVAAWQVRVYQRQMLVFVELLATVSTQVRAYESELARLLTQHADAAIFLSLPNAGVVTAAGLLGEIGDCRPKFASASGLQALAGTCPVTKQSNRVRWVEFRVGCCKPLRHASQQFARHSARGRTGSPWAKGYLHAQIQRGHSFSRASRALANRWLAIIFRLWQDRVLYDEQVHLRNRARRGVRLPA